MANKQGKMAGYINYRMRITLQDSRQLSGQLLAFDRHMNLVLADTDEFRQIKRKQNNQQTVLQQEKRTLGFIIVRGAQIVSLSVESPPPADPSTRLGKPSGGGLASTLASGPGVSKPAGRGAAAPISLAGPAPGVGGSAPFPGFSGAPGFPGRGGPTPPNFPGGFPPAGFPAGAPGLPPGFPPGGAPPPGFNPPPRR
ncbi:Sm-like ribonucleoprotein [Whalleya microplaca]|nr:Sm-like ribonucleoprotein [Whalleya microplaca]